MAQKKAAPPEKSFDTQLSEMDLEYLICMDIGHAWNPATMEVAYGDFQVGLVCVGDGKNRKGCGMERDRWRGPDRKLRNRYWHPRGDYGFRKTGWRTPDQREAIRQAWQEDMFGKLPESEHNRERDVA